MIRPPPKSPLFPYTTLFRSDDLLESDAQAPVVRMVNALLLQALRERASDIHFEPYEGRSVVRFRVDGVLRDVIEPPRGLHGARSEEHTSELQSQFHLVCRLL